MSDSTTTKPLRKGFWITSTGSGLEFGGEPIECESTITYNGPLVVYQFVGREWILIKEHPP